MWLFSCYNTTLHRSWPLCACFLTTQVVEPGGAARQARRRPKWVDVLGHTQHGHIRLFVLLLPWEHLRASERELQDTDRRRLVRQQEEWARLQHRRQCRHTAAPAPARRWPGRAKSSPAPTRRSYDAVGNHFEGENLAHFSNLAQSATYYLAANSLLQKIYTGHGR